MIGFGSIGRGMLPLLFRHFAFDRSRIVVVDPSSEGSEILEEYGVSRIQTAVTRENYRELLQPLLTNGGGQGFCVNVSVDTGSLDIMKLCREIGALYIDTVAEPWLGFYDAPDVHPSERSNYALRELVRDEKRRSPGGTTAVNCCGANPGMVSWFVKQALVDLKTELGIDVPEPGPDDREGWARLMASIGVKGIHIAERDTQRTHLPKPRDVFVNTWSVEGFIAEGFQPAELGWGTSEDWMPENGRRHDYGCKAAIYLEQPGANTRVRSWCPTPGPQFGFLVTHNEAISIADYFTVGEGDTPEYRPTCHYAYHPSNDAVLSLHELFGRPGLTQDEHVILAEDDIIAGKDELGVLLYGHDRNAYWFGSQLTIEETRKLAPYQNATGLQVTSAILAGMVWALENPEAGIVETDEMDYRRCLEIQRPYLGPLKGYYTDWTPLDGRPGMFPEDLDTENAWAFKNVLVR
jgi:homospermidine synthase